MLYPRAYFEFFIFLASSFGWLLQQPSRGSPLLQASAVCEELAGEAQCFFIEKYCGTVVFQGNAFQLHDTHEFLSFQAYLGLLQVPHSIDNTMHTLVCIIISWSLSLSLA